MQLLALDGSEATLGLCHLTQRLLSLVQIFTLHSPPPAGGKGFTNVRVPHGPSADARFLRSPGIPVQGQTR